MSKYFAGIRPTKPGYDEFCIKPQLSNLTSAECVVPSVKGYIKVIESNSGEEFRLHAELPNNTVCVIYLPYNQDETIICNGEIIYINHAFTGKSGLKQIGIRGGYFIIAVAADSNRILDFHVG